MPENSGIITREKIIDILRKELPYFISEYGIKRIGLFGSFAKGKPAKGSDVDILVEFEKPISLKFVEFAEYIERILGSKTDCFLSKKFRLCKLPTKS